MRSLVIATAVGAGAVSLAMSVVGAAYRAQTAPDTTSEPESHDGPQWIGSGHREVLLDPSVTDERDGQTVYPAHVSVDAEAVVDVQEVR